MINKVALRDDDCRKQFSVDRSEIGTKRHILTDKQGMPVSMTLSLSLSLSSATTYDIKLVKNIIDNSVI